MKWNIDELKHWLLNARLELKSIQMSAKEEKTRNEENMRQLLQLLKVALQERDEAKEQFQSLLYKLTQSTATELYQCLPVMQPESPALITTKGSPSVAESDSVSDTYNHHSYVSFSPVDSIFEGVSSPDLSIIKMGDSSNLGVQNQSLMQEFNGSFSRGMDSGMTHSDPASSRIDRLAAMKPLPEKGKLLKAVMEAGPPLQNLMLAGPLPQWRNPPMHSLPIPSVSISSHDDATLTPKLTVNPSIPVQSSLSTQGNSNVASQTCSTSMVKFSSSVSSCTVKRPILSSVADNGSAHNLRSVGIQRTHK